MRQIILDTETTGLRVEEGHRIIEIGCLEMVNRKLTGKHFHHFINPNREVEAGAFAVHGISNAFLSDKPLFETLVADFMAFISGAELIIHNAPFDVGFLDYELSLTRQGWKPIAEYCRVIDTLQIARQLHAGQRNTLDALCKRYAVDNSRRDLHGALIDANLLAQVYLLMTGGQESFFGEMTETPSSMLQTPETLAAMQSVHHNMVVVMATEEERKQHEQYLSLLREKGKCLWQT